jgi:membrane protein
MLANFDIHMTWKDLVTRTARETMSDDAQGLASQLAYYFFLALFPALLCFLAIASFFPLQNFTDDVIRLLGPFAPREILDIIRDQMVKIAEGQHGGLLTLGLLGAVWSSSSAMVAVTNAMNRAYDIEEGRRWWKVRLTAVGLTMALALFVTVALGLIVAGPEVLGALARRFSLGAAMVWTWTIVQWPVAFILVMIAFGLIYYFAPDAEQEWIWLTPGSFVATALWLIGSLLFRFYTTNMSNYVAAYGAIGGVIVLLLWFWMTALVIVIGAEMNAEIEHASPWGKAPGEKVAGERKKIGVAARAAYRERIRARETALVRRPVAALPPAPIAALRRTPSLSEKIVALAALVMLAWRRTKA